MQIKTNKRFKIRDKSKRRTTLTTELIVVVTTTTMVLTTRLETATRRMVPIGRGRDGLDQL